MDGTDLIAGQISGGVAHGPSFAQPSEAIEGWLPVGYRLVTDPEHSVLDSDCVLPNLATDWRLVGDINAGERVGRCAKDIGNDIRHVATKP